MIGALMLQTSDYEEHEVTWTDMEQLWMAGGPAELLEPCDLPSRKGACSLPAPSENNPWQGGGQP